MKLFNDITRSYLGPADQNENPYDFYNRTANPNFSIIRNKLNEWFDHYPESEKKKLKSDFEVCFPDAFYELFLFNLFKSMGFEIVVHPRLFHTEKMPDFLIKKGDLEIYVEAKICKDKTREDELFERMQNELFDILNKINSTNYMLAIEKIIFKSGRQPSGKKIKKEIESKLKELNKAEIIEYAKNERYRNTHIEYSDADVYLVLNPIPIDSTKDNENDRRAIGIYPMEFFNDGGEESLRSAVEVKSSRYGKLDKPFLICINALGVKTNSREDVDNAIWGSVALEYSEDPSNKYERWIRMPDGVFFDKYGPKKKNLSGVFVTRVNPANIPVADNWLYKHPYTNNELDFDDLGLAYSYIENATTKSLGKNNFGEIMGIPSDWIKLGAF